MMDMMTIILCFLLKSYQTEDVTVKANEDLQIPASSALKEVKASVSLVVTSRQILVDGDPVIKLEQRQAESGALVSEVSEDDKKGELITELYEKLLEKAEEAKEIQNAAKGLAEAQFEGKILLQCDRRLPFSLIRQVMYTAGQAQFSKFQFVVVKGGS
jgi:hypothetical protein